MEDLNSEEGAFLEGVEHAIASDAPEQISELVSDFSDFCFKDSDAISASTPFSEAFVNHLLKIFEEEAFLRMESSSNLMILLHNDWGRFVKEQHAPLLKVLERMYPNLVDNTSHLIIAELFGEYLANSHGLQGLERLRATKDEVARAHIAHGLKGLALNAAEEGLRITAAARLREMAGDSSEVVRAEVAAAMNSLKRNPIARPKSR